MKRNICHIIYIVGLLFIFILEFNSIPEIPKFPKRAGGWFEGSAIIARNEGLFTTSLFTALYNPSKNNSGRNHRYNWNLYHKNKELSGFKDKDVYLSALRLDKQFYVIIDYALYKMGWEGSNYRTLRTISTLLGLFALYYFGRFII